jgi:hypothetical protein
MTLTVDEKRALRPKPLTSPETEFLALLRIKYPGVQWQINQFYLELRSPSTDCTLQLDFYSPELKLAFELQDQSHRSYAVFQWYDPDKHTPEAFRRHQENDIT